MDSRKTEKESLDALKTLLLQPENHRLKILEDRLDDPMKRADEISRALPEAVSLSVMSGNRLARVIQPVIDDSLKESVRKNPKGLADAIFPALGPGIRKAISSTLMGMIQSLNQVLNHSFSIQGLKWRFEAFKTGRQFAEVVMLHTLIFQVEQIFLVHSDTGIVLEHVVAEGAIIQDPDLVSGMLTAIQDFVRDSFNTDAGDDLETLRIGSDRSVWVEKGEHAFIAAVIKGTPPVELRTFYRETIEEVHIKASGALSDFDGDTTPFALFRETLNAGLQYKENQEKKKISPLVYLILGAIVIGSIALPWYWGYKALEVQKDWERRLAKLKNQKGVIVVSEGKSGEQYLVSGLKDPLVADPLDVLSPDEKAGILARWQPFYSLDPGFVFQRAEKILNPPSAVTLAFDRNIIIARGQASQKWIEAFVSRAVSIPGVDGYDMEGVVNTDHTALVKAMKNLAAVRVYFENDSTGFLEGQEGVLERGAGAALEIQRRMATLDTEVLITIVGHTDTSGTENYNLKLSRERAEKVSRIFIGQGMDPRFIKTRGVGTKIRFKEEAQYEDRQFNRAVTFKAEFKSPTGGKPE
ncbi:MAG: OmpA family protein [Desulfobacterales bacterium]|nr:OmpA family protein [Desulfobacterales bacterium]